MQALTLPSKGINPNESGRRKSSASNESNESNESDASNESNESNELNKSTIQKKTFGSHLNVSTQHKHN